MQMFVASVLEPVSTGACLFCMQMLAEAVLEPGHLQEPAANGVPGSVSCGHGMAAAQWEVEHLKQSLAAATQQEAAVM